MTETRSLSFKKSSYSDSGATCVEIRGDLHVVRDSKNPDGPVLVFPAGAVTEFVRSVKAGVL